MVSTIDNRKYEKVQHVLIKIIGVKMSPKNNYRKKRTYVLDFGIFGYIMRLGNNKIGRERGLWRRKRHIFA